MTDVWHFSSTGYVSFTWQLQLFVAFSVLFSLIIIALVCFDTIWFMFGMHLLLNVTVFLFNIVCSLCVGGKHVCKGKGTGSCLESRLHDNACSTDFTFPLARWAPMQPATIDPTLDLCTRYPLQLGGPRQCGIWSLPNTSTHGQRWESNPTPPDLESNALSTDPHAPTSLTS